MSTSAETALADGCPSVCAQPSREQVSVLVVEDESFVREAAAQILESAGYTVRRATNAAEARRELAACDGSLHVLLTDVVLPDYNGAELAGELCAAHPGMQAILMSGYLENWLNWQPGTLYLAKPFSLASLTAKVKEAETYTLGRTAVTASAACSE